MAYRPTIALHLPLVILWAFVGLSTGSLSRAGNLISPDAPEDKADADGLERGQVILDWNNQALQTVRDLSMGSFEAPRVYAMMNVAMFDAVNGIAPVIFDWALVRPISNFTVGNRLAAAAAAAHGVLSALFPKRAALYDSMLHKHFSVASQRQERLSTGLAWGKKVAGEILALMKADLELPSEVQPAGAGPGQFRKDWGSAAFRRSTPFVVGNLSDLVSPGPPSLTSREYAADHTEVRLLGDDAYKNKLYDEIYLFWTTGGGSASISGEFIKIAMVLAVQEKTISSLRRTVHLFTQLALALADASTVAVHDKYTHHFWSPATAINEADTDGNEATTMDAGWKPRCGSSGGSPEHISATSAGAAAGGAVLAAEFGDGVAFSFTGDNALAGERSFSSISEAVQEAGRSRIYGGINFDFSNRAGLKAGAAVAREVLANSLQYRKG
eukprot:CAMPEP_0170583736 /NCGR_PEP_ID=MMETSP0224-20130122/8302_1 /TAXON_ID=285029 /ORGANISM="Togula jolla, Strain CCCM 725" /LENGTH=441 /DNA_ID=CAMNT_0010907099 /DNA_START=45 /DNA_END=1367 /DNA_ORIENTATION=+